MWYPFGCSPGPLVAISHLHISGGFTHQLGTCASGVCGGIGAGTGSGRRRAVKIQGVRPWGENPVTGSPAKCQWEFCKNQMDSGAKTLESIQILEVLKKNIEYQKKNLKMAKGGRAVSFFQWN